HSHGSNRRHGFPARTFRSERQNSRGECRFDEGRPGPVQGRAGQGSRRPESETARQDQPARLQATDTVAKCQRQTRGLVTSGASKDQDTQGQGRRSEGQGFLTRNQNSIGRSQDLPITKSYIPRKGRFVYRKRRVRPDLLTASHLERDSSAHR